MTKIKLYYEYLKTLLWVVFKGVIKVTSLDTSNGMVTLAEKRGITLAIEKNHWVFSSGYLRRVEKMEIVDKGTYKGLLITYHLSSFDAGLVSDTREYYSYGQVRVIVQHEPQRGNHIFILGRNKDGTFWVATWRRVQGPYDKVEATIGEGIDEYRDGKTPTWDDSDWSQFMLGDTYPVKFIYNVF